MMKKNELRIIGAISIDLNDMPDEHQRNKKDKSNKFQILKEFCSNSTVHGIRYFTEQKRHWIERVWWMIAVALSMTCCAFGITAIWLKWYYRPVMVSFDDKTTSVGMITFPALTVCTTQKYIIDEVDINQIIQTFIEMENNQTAYKGLSPKTMNHFDAVMHVCSKELENAANDLIIPKTESIYTTLEKISPDVASVLPFSTFAGNLNHFRPIFTEEGLCFTFNALNSRDIYKDEIAPELMTVDYNPDAAYWNMIDGMDMNEIKNILYPFRVFGAGLRNGAAMMLGMVLDKSQEYCSSHAQGFRLSLHGPHEIPHSADDFIHIPVEQEIYVSIKPHLILTSNGLRGYPPSRRGCFFQSERQLRFFKSYCQRNCQLECLSNFTRETCNCVTFSMPRDKNTSVCTMFDIRCYVNAAYKFARDLLVKKCNCLPDCTSVTYDLEMSQAPFRYSDEDIALRKSLNQSSDDVTSKLFVSFRHPYFIAINRTETYTIADFTASVGGFLGLYMGISLLSIVELIYYFTLRLCCTLRQRDSIEAADSTWAKRNNFPLVNKQPNGKRR